MYKSTYEPYPIPRSSDMHHVSVTLDTATTEQLLDELRKRMAS